MKLLSKYNRANVLLTIIVLLLSAVFYYFFIEQALISQLDKNLVVEEKEITDYTNENKKLPDPSNSEDEQDIYTPANGSVMRKFSSIELHDTASNRSNYYRELEFPVSVDGKIYRVEVRKSQEETEGLVRLILKITFAMVVILLGTLFLINRFVLNKLWKPFNNTLQKIKQFNISGKEEIHFEKTNINEFAELNSAVSIMTKKATRDYNEIKNFTENASHEIQTPLAIIKSKLELLSQSESLKEEQMNAIQEISETTNRLSKLNQSLLLLTKIDNRQFKETEDVDISRLLLRRLSNYEELLEANQIRLLKKIKPGIILMLNETLVDILVTNLLTNAIKHNIKNGYIEIELGINSLAISNTGAVLSSDPSSLFERFKKESSSNNSLGLGLAIAKKICDTFGFGITYHYLQQVHTVTVRF